MNIEKNKKDLKTKIKKDLTLNLDSNSKKGIGNLGEDIAVLFLEKRGYQIIERNHRNKIGEIDIIAQKDDFYYVVEVKTLKIPSVVGGIERSRNGCDNFFNPEISVIRDSGGINWLRPEINLTKEKIRKVKQVALKYCLDFNLREENLKFIGICISLYHSGSRVTKSSLLSCKVKAIPLFD
jgi:Uncharacterised protein family UPF0102